MLVICLLTSVVSGCRTIDVTNATACHVGFDYYDTGANDQNVKALMAHYCICVDSKACEKSPGK